MYFAIGGRRTQSALYRVTYTGRENTQAVSALPPTAEAKLRRTLEALHADGVGAGAIDQAWPHLGHADRFVRFAARVAIERQPTAQWAERALAEKQPQAAIEALIALARLGDKSLQPRLIAALERIDFKSAAALQLPLLRAWQLAFTRMGKPDAATASRLAAKFEPLFPQRDALVNRELIALLVYLDSSVAIARAVPLLKVAEPVVRNAEQLGSAKLTTRNDTYGKVVDGVGDSRPDRQQIAYAYALRQATAGWTPALRSDYFAWFAGTSRWRGGASFSGFLQNIRMEALTLVSDEKERARLYTLSAAPAPASLALTIAPKGPGKTYTVATAAALVGPGLKGRNFAQGKAMYEAAACSACHALGGDGGSVGPDLTNAASRYSIRDLLENIIEPSLVISDQYGSEQVDQKDGSSVIGRVLGEEKGELVIAANPFAPAERTRVKLSAITARKTFPMSIMPPGLINALNEEELKDLLAYVLSGGKANDARFAR
jgi:putative heme-binding domain-containing protein